MGRPPKRQRASEGKRTLKHVKRNGKIYDYIEYSFVTPPEAFSKWPELRLPERTRKTFTESRKLDGEAWLNENLRAIHAGVWVPEKLRKAERRRELITFRQYAVPWVESRKKADGSDLKQTAKQKYRESLNLYLLDFFGDMPMSEITPKDVQRWWDTFKTVRLDANLEDRRYHVYKHLKTIMNSAASEPVDDTGKTLIPSNPCQIKAVRPLIKHEPVRPTDDQWSALMDVLPDWARMVAAICDKAALREGEALGLCRRHIDLDNLVIHVEQQSQRTPNGKGKYSTEITTPKTRSSIRDVHIPRTLADMLSEWMTTHEITQSDMLLFTSSRTGRQLAPQNYRNAFARACKKIPGLETMRPHDLRKDALSRMVEHGATVSEVMRQGGHTSMSVASVYQTIGDHLTEVMNEVDKAEQSVSAAGEEESRTMAREIKSDDAQSIIGVLAGMPLDQRISVLHSLSPARRASVIELLPDAVKIETLSAILGGAEGDTPKV
ncbi:integrase [Bifidobacterium myosotis]|uniref:Integrase n=1 Tax=Bifidobacterium myosotis TaxID=1630166 RepID=A0A261FR36_9BIFI|nr:tyrosine-type recombinase/integrase [Bifidobacterium myosotis]OZG61651.1 integrase [Bifidobacterium myosotis]